TSTCGLVLGLDATGGVTVPTVPKGPEPRLRTGPLSGEAARDLGRARAVPTPEDAGVDEQREELVHADAFLPALGERRDLLVGRQHPRQVGQAEEREHREVRLAVAAVRGGVDRAAAALVRPDDVAVPEVAVQAGRALLGHQVGQASDDALDG